MGTRRYMDWTGNIIEDESKEIHTIRTSEGTEYDLGTVEDPLEQHMANINQDNEDPELTESGCSFETDNLFECPNFFPILDDSVPDVVECAVCGRMDWRRKDSIGKKQGGEVLV